MDKTESQNLAERLQVNFLADIIAHRSVLGALLDQLRSMLTEEQSNHAFDYSMSLIRNSKFGGFTPEQQLEILSSAEQRATVIFTIHRAKPPGD